MGDPAKSEFEAFQRALAENPTKLLGVSYEEVRDERRRHELAQLAELRGGSLDQPARSNDAPAKSDNGAFSREVLGELTKLLGLPYEELLGMTRDLYVDGEAFVVVRIPAEVEAEDVFEAEESPEAPNT